MNYDSDNQGRKLLIIKAGSLAERAPKIVEQFGDSDGMFMNAAEMAPKHFAVACVYEDEAIGEPPQSFAGVLVTGSGAMISSPTPWMESTAAWLREAVDANVPVLGVCFGHQMLAYSLGGTVGPNPNGPEAGSISVNFNAKTGNDPLFAGFPDEAKFNSHHYETVLELPPGATVLANNERDKYQAVRYASKAWGVQFHPEISDSIMRALLDIVGEKLEKNGQSVETIDRAIESTPYGPQLLQRFFGMALAG
ncbi:glutamine amidotransferase [Mesorhizobium sp. CO1-1-8]|uniref:glutamine amidotransferase n=1 Tax=Mesorhizobium sp. CO1-1-8 TaxID=2876631 RepID=UPI001CD17A55|nr:glutamine amidotransferase [Mesorhizobium sp. CO1-1-8]MBZ9772483.1 glutamine amidotransferase [Mesorhizobium sp. CO1-1-8]